MELLAVFATLAILIVLISALRLHPFLAFLISAIAGAIMLGIPLDRIPDSLQNGLGNTLGGLTIVLCLGAMFGKLVAQSGAAQKIATVLMRVCGPRYVTWALMLTGFIVGIPLFYNVGFVLLVPLVFSVMYQSRLPAVYLGIPLLAALSVTHGFLPPHPSPTALVPQFGADMGTTLVYGIIVAIPAMVLAGPVFSRFLKGIESSPLSIFHVESRDDDALPSTFNAFATALLPVVLIAASAAIPAFNDTDKPGAALSFFGNANIVMMLSLAVATVSLGLNRGKSMNEVMSLYADAVKDIAVILLIIAGAGTLKQVFIDSGVSAQLGELMTGVDVHPLILAWLVATVIRICLGSATVAGLTAAGIVAPLALNGHVDPNLLVLAVGAGSLMCSHVNDSGFWMYKEYFNLSIKDTFKSWTVMETIVGVTGLAAVLVLDVFI